MMVLPLPYAAPLSNEQVSVQFIATKVISLFCGLSFFLPSICSQSESKSVIIQLFGWNWDSIAAECTNFIGPAGYGYVQVSPPGEQISGPQWWTDYQVVSYDLTSKRGNRTQFQNMINACHTAGVNVIADTLFNHMTNMDSGTGVAGSSYTHYDYPGIYQYEDFHHCGLEPNDIIVDYSNRLEVQTCQLNGLADLATNTSYVQGRLAQYANDLLSLGVDGLRLDASKHIAADEIAAILKLLNKKPSYITQEVIWGYNEPIQPTEYVDNGQVQEFRYTSTLQSAFLGGGISSLRDLDGNGWISGSDANVFVANHDTERNGASLYYNSPGNTYVTGMIFSLAHPYGTPTILSSFQYSTFDDGAPNGGAGTCSGTGGTGGWLCQHRWAALTGMVGWRNNVGNATMNNWVSPQSSQIAFGRGSLGFVAINNADDVWTATFETSLADGEYCDVVGGQSSGGQCTGFAYTVSGGSFTANVPSRNAIAIHTGALGTSNSVLTTFAENATTSFGENIFLVGSIQALSNWDTFTAIPLSTTCYPIWTVTVALPPNTTFEYKFIKREADASIVWESDPNRQAATGGAGTPLMLNSSWK